MPKLKVEHLNLHYALCWVILKGYIVMLTFLQKLVKTMFLWFLAQDERFSYSKK